MAVNPIPTIGADNAHSTTTGPPRFLDFAASLLCNFCDLLRKPELKDHSQAVRNVDFYSGTFLSLIFWLQFLNSVSI